MTGTWVNADTVVTKTEFKGENGPETYVSTSLYQHFQITDSTFVDTVVLEDSYSSSLLAYAFVTPYRVEDGRIVLEDDRIEGDPVEVRFAIEGDTLKTVALDSGGAVVGTMDYVREEQSGVPPALVGSWVGDMVEEGTGVVFSVGLRFHPDGTMETLPDGVPLRFVVMGPFLLFDSAASDNIYPDDLEAAGIPNYEQVFGFEVEGDWLRVRFDDTEVVMQRQRPRGKSVALHVPMALKSTVDEIRARFDADVERFSSLEVGQATTIDAPLVLELIAEAAEACTPDATRLLDIGCGAGNYALRLLQQIPDLEVDLVDLSQPMLDRALERIEAATSRPVRAIQADIRDLDLEAGRYDVVVTGAAMHHLRTDAEWEAVFESVYRSLRPGGSFWLSDLVSHDLPSVQSLMWSRYGDYLVDLEDEAFRDRVFAYVDKEDTPRSALYQTDLLRRVGFQHVEVLHKTSVFAAFGGVR